METRGKWRKERAKTADTFCTLGHTTEKGNKHEPQRGIRIGREEIPSRIEAEQEGGHVGKGEKEGKKEEKKRRGGLSFQGHRRIDHLGEEKR